MKESEIKVGTILTPTKQGVKTINSHLSIRGSRNYIVPGEKMICVYVGKYNMYMSLPCYEKHKGASSTKLVTRNDAVSLLFYNFAESQNRNWLKPVAGVVAFFDWLGQQNETLKHCYSKRLDMWGVK